MFTSLSLEQNKCPVLLVPLESLYGNLKFSCRINLLNKNTQNILDNTQREKHSLQLVSSLLVEVINHLGNSTCCNPSALNSFGGIALKTKTQQANSEVLMKVKESIGRHFWFWKKWKKSGCLPRDGFIYLNGVQLLSTKDI